MAEPAEPQGAGDAGRRAPAPGALTEVAAPIGDPTKSAFLADASRLLASSLDYETTLGTVAGLALPELGSWCIVDVVEEDGSFRRLSIVHPDPDRQQLVSRLVDCWPPHREDPIGAPVVMRTREPEIISRVTDEFLERVSRSEETLKLLRTLGIGSVIVLPLIAREHVLGAMTFIASTPRTTPEDGLEVAQDLATRCAMAIDNARLYRQAQRARHEAEVAERTKSQFLAMTSHEIRTPINAIIGYSQILEMGLAGPLTDKQREHLERIQASSQHLLGMVNEILDLAKVEAGQVMVHNEPANAADSIRAALEFVTEQMAECGLLLERDCSEAVSYVGDPGRVRQILVSLLTNACKFTESGGTVRTRCGVSAELPSEARLSGSGPWVFIEVADTGIGIAPSHQRRIFDPFVQVSSGMTRVRDGSGLGLALSRQLARLMGGDLTVRSRVGSGSTFTLWLPCATDVACTDAAKRLATTTEPTGLDVIAGVILERIDPILEAYASRMYSESIVPDVDRISAVALRNHLPGLLSEAAQMLLMLHERGGLATEVLRDGSRIQRVIAQLHGSQRRSLGFTEESIRDEFQILREVLRREVEVAVRDSGAPPDGELESALAMLDRLLEQAERTSCRSWRMAAVGR